MCLQNGPGYQLEGVRVVDKDEEGGTSRGETRHKSGRERKTDLSDAIDCNLIQHTLAHTGGGGQESA